MMGIVHFEVLIVLVLFTAIGALAMSEMTVVSSQKSRLKQMAASGNSGAAAALHLSETRIRFLPTVPIGINVIGLLAGCFSGATLAEEPADRLKALRELVPSAVASADGEHSAISA
jgi:putative hemolysin